MSNVMTSGIMYGDISSTNFAISSIYDSLVSNIDNNLYS